MQKLKNIMPLDKIILFFHETLETERVTTKAHEYSIKELLLIPNHKRKIQRKL